MMILENLYKLHGCDLQETMVATKNMNKKIMFPMEAILREKKGEQQLKLNVPKTFGTE